MTDLSDPRLPRLSETMEAASVNRRTFLRSAALLAATPGLAGLLAACGGGSESSGKTGNAGTLVYGMEIATIPSLDPVMALGSGSTLVQAVLPMFEGLVMNDSDTVKQQPAYGTPRLATSWKLLDGGKTWEWSLRPSVTFHDGTPWNADAAIWNFQRLYDKTSKAYDATAASLVGLYMPGPILSMKKIDDLTFQMTLPVVRPLNEELGWIWMISPTALQKLGNEGFAVAPVGTGGMKFDKLVAGQQFEMVPYDKYWGKGYKLDRLIVRPIADASARATALLSGDIDMGIELDPDSLDPLKKAKVTVEIADRLHTWDVLFNTQAAPFNNKKVRQALNYAIDRESIANNILKGTATPMKQFVTQSSPWYDPTIQPYTYDPAKAKSMLADAGYPQGFSTNWLVPINGSGMLKPVPMMETIQSNLADIGVKVEITSYEWTDYLSVFFKGMPAGVDAMAISYGIQWTYWWGLLFSTQYLPPNGVLNPGKYTNAAIDPLYEQALTVAASDQEKSAGFVRQLEAIVWDDAPWLFVVHGSEVRGMNSQVQGFINTEAWMFDWQPISKD